MHWLMDMLQSIDVGLVVIDKEYKVQLWNNFMENHSGIKPGSIIDKNIFDTFADIPKAWFKGKIDSVFMLNSRAFITWEQRPYLFKFKNYRPITGGTEFMYQNITFIPMTNTAGEVTSVCVILYDVTDMAVNKSGMIEANTTLESLSRTDMLTQLNNRGYWEECLSQEFMRFHRSKQPCTLIMFDIDHFKKVNDTYGHQAGDEVIRVSSQLLRDSIRQTDTAGRYGGEEFGIILFDTVAINAKILSERLRKKIEATTVTYDGMDIKYTISLGLAEITADIETYQQWLECSDKALYQAKESGRNKSVIYKE